MNFITRLRAERHILEITSSTNRARPETQHAISRLKELGPEVIEPVINALSDADANATVALVEVLSALITEPTFPEFLRALMKGDPRITSGVAWAMMGSRAYPEFLLLEALATPGVPKAPVLEIINKQKTRFSVRQLLTAAFGQQAQEKTSEKGERATERAVLFRIAGDIAKPEDLPLILAQVKFCQDAMSRVHLINLMARFSDPAVHSALTGLLHDPDKVIRLAVLNALLRTTAPVDVPSVCQLLRDPDSEVRRRAVDLLVAGARGPETVSCLRDVIRDAEPEGRQAALEVLREIEDGVRQLLVACLEKEDWELQEQVSTALGQAQDAKLIETTLALALQDPDPGVRRMAIGVLKHAQDPAAVDELFDAANDPDPLLNKQAVDVLAEIGSQREVPRLLQLLDSQPQPSALASIVRAIGRLGSSQQMDVLLPLREHANKRVQIETIQALANLVPLERTEELKQMLRPLSRSHDSEIARFTAMAIAVMDSRTERQLAPQLVPEDDSEGAEVAVVAGRHPRPARARGPAWHPPQARAPATPVPRHPPPPVAPVRAAPPPSPLALVRAVPPAPSPIVQPAGFDPSQLVPGDILEGRYRFIERIGKGAFGTVILVEDTAVNEQLILKFINRNLATDEEVARRFKHELRYSRRITHPNVIRIYDYHSIRGNHAISMEYFPSHTLAFELASQQPLDTTRALKLAIDICHGMEAAHAQDIVHRDLKPANVLINDDDWLKIVDFGVAAVANGLMEENPEEADLTKPGYVIGSPKYMAPEQIKGEPIDHRADIYALGIILYEMTTGVPPYVGTQVAMMMQHVQGRARPAHEVNPVLADHFSAVIMRAMAVETDDRFQSMPELRAALEEYYSPP